MTIGAQEPPAGGNHPTTRPLWAAVTVLAVAVLVLGASLIHLQTRPVDGNAVSSPAGPAPQSAATVPTLLPATEEPKADPSRLPVTTVAPGEMVLPPREATAVMPLPTAPRTAMQLPPAATGGMQWPPPPAPAMQLPPATPDAVRLPTAPMAARQSPPAAAMPLPPAPMAVGVPDNVVTSQPTPWPLPLPSSQPQMQPPPAPSPTPRNYGLERH